MLHHELVHAVINEVYYGGSIEGLIQMGQRMRIPHWFNEGLAEYLALGWDTQSDMALALIGAICALLLLSRLHDRQLAAFAWSGRTMACVDP